MEHKLVSFAAVVALWTLETLLIKLIRKGKYTQDKNYAILAAMFRKESYFVLEIFISVTQAGVFIRENFHPVSERSRESRLLIWTHRDFYEWKSGEARSRNPSQPGWPSLHEEALKSAFHLSRQICGSFIGALGQTGIKHQSKQYQLFRFCENKNLAFYRLTLIV